MLDGATEPDVEQAPTPPDGSREVAELIGQECLSLGDGMQRGTIAPARRSDAEATARPPGDEPGDLASDTAVLIEVRRLPTRGGRRPSAEKYPFGAIGLARDAGGFLEGESFLIPYEDEPRRRIAAGRKRHKPDGKRFLTRSEEAGVRVWRDR